MYASNYIEVQTEFNLDESMFKNITLGADINKNPEFYSSEILYFILKYLVAPEKV